MYIQTPHSPAAGEEECNKVPQLTWCCEVEVRGFNLPDEGRSYWSPYTVTVFHLLCIETKFTNI